MNVVIVVLCLCGVVYGFPGYGPLAPTNFLPADAKTPQSICSSSLNPVGFVAEGMVAINSTEGKMMLGVYGWDGSAPSRVEKVDFLPQAFVALPSTSGGSSVGFGIGNIDTGAPIMTNVLYKTEGAGASVVLENNITENALYIALFANPATGGMETEPYVVDAATSSVSLLAVDVASGSLAKAVSFDVENGLPEPVTVGNTRFMAVAAQGQSFLASLGAPGTRMSVEWKVAFNVSMMAHPKQAIVFLEGVAGDVLIVTVSNPSSPESDVPTTCAVDVSSPTSAAKYMWCYSALDDIVTVAVGGDLVLFGLGSTNTVLAVDASTGKEAWKGTFPFPLSRGQVFSSSARIFLQNAPGPDPICLYEIDANNGSVVDLSPLLPPSTQATMDIWSTTLGGASITDDVLIWTYIAPNNNGQSCMTLIQVPGRE